jgi:hypothetical protein
MNALFRSYLVTYLVYMCMGPGTEADTTTEMKKDEKETLIRQQL